MSARFLAIAAGLLACCGLLAAAPAESPGVYFPTGYRGWTVSKFRLIGPDSPLFERNGGFRHYFANPTALASWGRFSDGAVIVDERVHAQRNDRGVWEEAGLAHVAVMLKDAARFPDTGGWYFNQFGPGDTTTGLSAAQAKAACFDACHASQSARDFVFSDPRR